MTKNQIDELGKFAHFADKEARSDLAGGFISSEDDYTSNFTGALRRIINSNATSGLTATSFVLAPKVEQRTGCDATIIISSNGHFKIAMFEAKWPRFGTAHYRWDYGQTASGHSHFSDQLQRQAKNWPRFAVFEMIYCETPFNKQPIHLQAEGSTCVWHDDAIAFDRIRRSAPYDWSQSDLDAMLKNRSYGIREVIEATCNCSRGAAMSMWGDAEAVTREFSIEGPVLHISASK